MALSRLHAWWPRAAQAIRHAETWRVVAFTALVYALFIAARLAAHGYDPSFFVRAGDWFNDPARVPANLHLLRHAVGYDGQAYYRLALDPLTASQTAHGMTLDDLPYRQQRILYPLLVWAVSLGRPWPVPLALIAVNFAGLCLLAGIGARYARLLGQPAALGALFAFYSGYLVTLANDLTEIVAGACLLGALVLVRQHRYTPAALALAASALARETALVLAVAIVAVWLVAALRRRPVPVPLRVAAVPLGVEAAWQLLLLARLGSLPLRSSGGQGNVPLQGFASLLYYLLAHPPSETVLSVAQLLALGLFAASTLLVLRHTAAMAHEWLAWLLYAGMVLMLNHNVWLDYIGLMRACSEVYLLGVVLLLGSRWPGRLAVFAAPLGLWAVCFAVWAVGSR